MSAGDRPQLRLGMSAAEEGAADFGTSLRRAREARGLTLQDLAVTTKISASVLGALERNEPGKLPGGIFSRAFVRAYAREVGLDPESTVARFVAAFPADSGASGIPPPALADAEGFERHRRTAAAAVRILGAAAIVVALGLMGFAWWQRSGRTEEAADARAPVALDGSLGSPASIVGEAPPAAPASPGPQSDTTPSADDAPLPVPSERAAGLPTSQPDGTQAAGQHGAPLVVGLRAEGECWLSVTVDGTTQPQRTLGPGEHAEFRVRKLLTMRIGNAGAIAMTLNGAPAKPLGRAGEAVTATIPADGFGSLLR